MNELSIIEKAYWEKVEKVADEYVETLFDLSRVDEDWDEVGNIMYSIHFEYLKNLFDDMLFDDVIYLITSNREWVKKSEDKRGLLIGVETIRQLDTHDLDDSQWAVENLKIDFIAAHADVVDVILHDIHAAMEPILQKKAEEDRLIAD